MSDSPSIPSGTKLGAFTIGRPIGSGGMGEVYEAVEEKTERRVALKVLRSGSGPDDTAARFVSEAKALGRVNNENVVGLFAIGEAEGHQFIAMEYVDGVTVKDLLSQFVFSADEAVLLMIQLLRGLSALHGQSIVHRDLKPNNLILKSNGVLKILDLGIAKNLGDGDITKTGMLIGTVNYMPPEVVYGGEASPRGDLWTVGAIFFECLTGRQLAGKKGATAVEYPKESQSWIPGNIRAIIAKLCSANPDQRYASADEVLRDLENFRKLRPALPSHTLAALAKKVENLPSLASEFENSDITNVMLKRAMAMSTLMAHTTGSSTDKTELITQQSSIHLDAEAVLKALDAMKPKVNLMPLAPPQAQQRDLTAQWLGLIIILALGGLGYLKFKPKSEIKVATAPPVAVPSPAATPAVNLMPVTTGVLWAPPAANFDLRWQPKLAGALLQVSKSEKFESLDTNSYVSGDSAQFGRLLAEGRYFWRLQDGQVNHGPYEITLARAGPLTMNEPAAGANLDIPDGNYEGRLAVTFTWDCKLGAKVYRVQVSSTADFAKSIVEGQVKSCEWPAVSVPVGALFWRVRVDSPAEAAVWGTPRPFQVRDKVMRLAEQAKAMPADNKMAQNLPSQQADDWGDDGAREFAARAPAARPKLSAPIDLKPLSGTSLLIDNSGRAPVTLSWGKVDGAEGYTIEISKAEQFTTPIVKRTLEPAATLPTRFFNSGRVYWRVKADRRGADTTWSEIFYFENPNGN
jgi:serine/threonine protein kinase